MTSRSVFATTSVVAGGLGGHDAADQHQRDGPSSADLGPVLDDLPLRHSRADLPDQPAQHGVSLAVHSFSFTRLRIAYAILDWRLHSSMKPGLACCEKRPPDSPKPASAGS